MNVKQLVRIFCMPQPKSLINPEPRPGDRSTYETTANDAFGDYPAV
jgi:hypothetical protein